MPRAIDLYPHNMRISNPNNTIQFDPRAILAQADEIPELIVEALISLVNAWVAAIEGVTGIPISTLLPIDRCEQLARAIAANVGTGETAAVAVELAVTVVAELLEALFDTDVAGFVNRLVQIPDNILNLFRIISVGALSPKGPNLWPAGAFPAGSVSGAGDWVLDPTVSHTPTDTTNPLGLPSTGSAKVIADGTDQALRSIATTVNAGQELSVSVFVKWAGFTGTNNPVRFQIAEYADGVQVGIVDIEIFTPTPDGDWRQLSGVYTVPAGVNSVRGRFYLGSDATAGTLWWDDAEAYQTGLLPANLVAGLPESIQDLLARVQAVIDTVIHALTGSTDLLHSLEDLILALLNIPFGNVLGVGGPTNIGQSILDLIDHIVGGLVGTPGTGAGLADLFNINRLVSSWAALGNMAWEILGIRNNTPIYTGLLPNGKSNFPITGVNTTLDATQAASLIATYRVEESFPLGVVSWLGYGITGITAFYVNIWQIDNTSGNWTLVHHSPSIAGDLVAGTTPQWNFYELVDPLAAVAGEQYAFELVPVGATHHVRGMDTGDDIPDHPFAKTVALAATRNNTTSPDTPPSTIAKTSVTRSSKVPWIEIAIDTGTTQGHHDPVTIYFTESGTVPIPTFAKYIEAIGVGSAGGGKSGGTAGFYGEGGSPGKWAAIVWERGVDFDDSDVSVTVTIGDGGTGGVLFGDGGTGDPTTIAVADETLTADGGEGGNSLRLGGQTFIGVGPGNYTFNGQVYVGGGNQNVFSSGGTSPGGGGAGGNWITVSPGGDGGRGAAWLRFRQEDITNDIPDTTPPTTPTVTLDDATYSTITVTASGSTDE